MQTKIGKPSFSRYSSGLTHTGTDISLDRAIASSPQTLSIVDSPFSSKRNSHSSAISQFSRNSSMVLSMPPIIDHAKSPLCNDSTFPTSSFINDSDPIPKTSFSVLQSPTPHTPMHHSIPNEYCAFCTELLLANFPGEATVTLTCSHHSHGQCFKLLGGDSSVQDGPLICNLCNRATGIRKSGPTRGEVVMDQLPKLDFKALPPSMNCITSRDSSATSPMTPLGQMIPDTLTKPPHRIQCDAEDITFQTTSRQPNASFSHLLSPEQESTFNCTDFNLQEDITNPSVSFTTNVVDPSQDVTCLLTIKPPAICSLPKASDSESTLAQNLVECFKSRLTGISNWQASIGFEGLGDLCIVDTLNVSTNGYNWDQLCCFCFEKGLLILNHNTNTLIGQIIYNQDSCGIDCSDNVITFSLISEQVPGLQLSHWQPVIMNKWWYYLKKLTRSSDNVVVPLAHLSANCWQLVSDTEFFDQLPSKLLELQEFVEKPGILNIPSNLLIQTTPEPEPLPLTLIVSVCLINSSINPPISNEKYKSKIVRMVNKIRAQLRPQDKLGLIQVGFGGSGAQKGTFTGCINGGWSGWDGILQTLEIIPNRNYNCRPIVTNALDEFLIAFKKCKSLSCFFPNEVHSNNRFMILQANNYDVDTKADLEEFMKLQLAGEPIASFNKSHNLSVLKYLSDAIQFLRSSTSLSSIDIIRIGHVYSSEVLAVHKVITNTVRSPSKINITFGDRLIRFNSLDEFVDNELINVMKSYQEICVPKIVIMLKTQQSVKLKKIEANGGEVSINDSNVKDVQITINGLSPGIDRNIMLKLKLHADTIAQKGNVPMIGYHMQCFDQLTSEKVLSSRVSQLYGDAIRSNDIFNAGTSNSDSSSCGVSTMFASQFAMLTPPRSENDHEDYDKIPLLPPLESKGDRTLMRRQIELKIIELMDNISITLPANSNQKIIRDILTRIRELMRGTDIDSQLQLGSEDQTKLTKGELKKSFHGQNLSHYEYMVYIVNELRYLYQLFEKVENTESAVVRCWDFVNCLV